MHRFIINPRKRTTEFVNFFCRIVLKKDEQLTELNKIL